MQTTSSAHIILALETFCADTGAYTKTDHADFDLDQKLIGGATLRYINKHLVRMARVYITEKHQ